MLTWDDYEEPAATPPPRANAVERTEAPPAPLALAPTPRASVAEVELPPVVDADRSNLEKAQAAVAALDPKAEFRAYEGSLERVTVDQKRMINCRADLNQLVPFKYDWAWQKYLDGCANHWMPQEINMTADIALWKTDGGPVRRRAPNRQAQSRLLLDRRFAGGQQSGAGDLSAGHEPGMPPVPAAPGVRGSDSHPRISIRDRIARHGRRRDLQHVPRGTRRLRAKHRGRLKYTRDLSDPTVHDRHHRNRQRSAAQPDRLLLRARRHLLLLRLHADPLHGPPQQDDRHRRNSSSTSCATNPCT